MRIPPFTVTPEKPGPKDRIGEHPAPFKGMTGFRPGRRGHRVYPTLGLKNPAMTKRLRNRPIPPICLAARLYAGDFEWPLPGATVDAASLLPCVAPDLS